MRILLVEDEPGAAAAMARYLSLHGHEVVATHAAAAALRAAEQLDPDALIADWRLSHDMDGVALARRLRDRWPGLLVILVSAYPAQSLRLAAQDLPNAHVLGKPLRLGALLQALTGEPGD